MFLFGYGILRCKTPLTETGPRVFYLGKDGKRVREHLSLAFLSLLCSVQSYEVGVAVFDDDFQTFFELISKIVNRHSFH